MTAAIASSGLPVSLASTTPSACKTASVLVQLLSAGTCSITASQPGNGSYNAATPVTRSFTVAQANPSGTLMPAPNSPFTVGTKPYSAAAGDFNGDGILDLATANYGDNTVTVLLGSPSGVFTAAPSSPISVGLNPISLVVGTSTPMAFRTLQSQIAQSNSVTILLGNGMGGFAAASGSPLPVGTNPHSIAAGDFNGDGIQDLAVANFTATAP